MTCGTFTVSGVPQPDVQNTIALYKASKPPPTSVTSAADGTGTYTITVVYPPCPANVTHDPAGAIAGTG
jgi:hypothetical protein